MIDLKNDSKTYKHLNADVKYWFNTEHNTNLLIVLITLFGALVIIHTMFTFLGVVQQKEMKNIYNILITICFYVLLIIHISCLAYGLAKENGSIKILTIKYYLFYQLPFDILNIAIIAHIF